MTFFQQLGILAAMEAEQQKRETMNDSAYPPEQICQQCGVVRPCYVHDGFPAPVVAEVRQHETFEQLLERAVNAPKLDTSDPKAVREWAEKLAADGVAAGECETVAEVRRAPIDLEGIKARLCAVNVNSVSKADMWALLAEVGRLTNELGIERNAASHWFKEANRDHNTLEKLRAKLTTPREDV